MTDSEPSPRQKYISYLYGLNGALNSGNQGKAGDARRNLAHLRNSFADSRRLEGAQVVFRHNPHVDEAEQEAWLLVGALFALHPLVWRAGRGPRSLGASFGRLARKVNAPSVDRRFTQLLARDAHALPHHLRQAVRLLSAHDVPVDYGLLLDDLIILLGKDHRGDRGSRVRLKWAREYHMPISAETNENSDEPSTELPEKAK